MATPRSCNRAGYHRLNELRADSNSHVATRAHRWVLRLLGAALFVDAMGKPAVWDKLAMDFCLYSRASVTRNYQREFVLCLVRPGRRNCRQPLVATGNRPTRTSS